MTARTTTLSGAPTWIEVTSSDQARSIAFYTALFGWAAEDPDPQLGGYADFSLHGGAIAGSMPAPESGAPDAWLVYFATDDATTTAALAAAQGGSVVVPPVAVMEFGELAVLTDPGGAAFGAWKAGTHHGFTAVEEPGAPSWFELHTTDYDAVIAFYTGVLGWQTETVADVPGFRYTCLVSGGEQLAGVMDASAFQPAGAASWKVYFHVDDVDVAVTQAVELGASVVEPAVDTPYGRMATLTDPVGALFKLREPPAA